MTRFVYTQYLQTDYMCLLCREKEHEYEMLRLFFQAPNNQVTYAMTANSPNRNLFFVDVDGFVYLRNSLVGTTGDPYTVRNAASPSVQLLTRNIWAMNVYSWLYVWFVLNLNMN